MAINIKKSHEGLLHKNLGVKKDKPIPASKLKIKSTDSPAVKKRKQFALNAKKWHHGDDGLSIPPLAQIQPISDYNPEMVSSTDYIDPNIKPLEYTGSQAKKKNPFDVRDNIIGGLALLDTILPTHPVDTMPINRQTTYNQNPYGTGSEALYDNGGFIDGPGDKKQPKPRTKEEQTAHLLYPYPTYRDKQSPLYGTNDGRATSDSAGYVNGYRSKLPPSDMYPNGFELKSPVQSGYYDRLLDNHLPIPSFIPNSSVRNYANGGSTGPGDPADKSKLYSNWNRVVDYAKKKGYTPEQLDHDSNVGYGIIDEYNKLNPDNQFDRTKVKDIQQLMNQYRQKTIDGFKNYTPEQLKVNDPSKQYGSDYSGFMSGLSKEDNFPGHRTLGWKVPVEYMPNSTQSMSGPVKGFAPITRGTIPSNEPVPLNIKQDDHSANPAAAAYLRSLTSSYDNGGSIKSISGSSIPSQTFEFKGASHEDGGIPINYNGNKIEVEGNETGHIDDSGNLIIAGNMNYPGTNKKFKTISKQIGTKENKVNKVMLKASDIEDSIINPYEKFDMLKSNSVKLMKDGSEMKLKDLAAQKEHMSMIQQAMLDTATEFNLDPQEMSKGNIKKAKNIGNKSKYGSMTKYENGGKSGPGEGTRSDRNNNPGNIKYGAFAKRLGATGQDKDGFAIFPSRGTGAKAMKTLLTGGSYNSLSVNDAINKWTAGKPYDLSGLSDIKDKKISDLSPDKLKYVLDYMTKGEGTKYPSVGAIPSNNSSAYLPNINIKAKVPTTNEPDYSYTPQMVSSNTVTPMNPISTTTSNSSVTPVITDPFTVRENKVLPSNKENLDISQLYPEIYAAATNRVEPVRMQQYDPQLKQPYQVSFQDRLNENNASFRGIESLVDYNPTALSTLAGQKYSADSNVLADEFRQNDSQNRGIYNDNINTLNDAQLKNLQLADQQYVRQSEAKSKTKATDEAILSSVSSKYLQNKLENRQLQAAESYTGMRFDPETGQLKWYGGEAPIRYNYNPQTGEKIDNTQTSTTVRYDPMTGQPLSKSITTREKPEKHKNGGSVSSLYNQIYGKHR